MTYHPLVTPTEPIDWALEQARRAAAKLHRDFPMVAREDILQTLGEWVIRRDAKVIEYYQDEAEGERKLWVALTQFGRTHCLKEKCQAGGYKFEDLYFYSIKQLFWLLEDVYFYERWPEGPVGDEQPRRGKVKHSPLAEGANRLAMLADVSRALGKLNAEDQILLRGRFGTVLAEHGLAEAYDISISNLRTRVRRAVRRLQKVLGGEPPYHYTKPHPGPNVPAIRNPMTNAAARALTEDQENG